MIGMEHDLDDVALTAAWIRFQRLSCGYQGRNTLAEAIYTYLEHVRRPAPDAVTKRRT